MSLTTCQRIYQQPYPELRRRGHDYQRQLLGALRQGNIDEARTIMADHMLTAQALMESREAMLDKAFFKADEASTQGPSREYLALRNLSYRPDLSYRSGEAEHDPDASRD
ncbi:hypothetical protein [Halomonas korlensis]|nr:hypothetical protein [Halomonas korlensis]